MRHGTTGRRHRHRGNNNNSNGGGRRHSGGGSSSGNHNRNQVLDSNGPDVRIRGTAHQVCEKYLTLAKDAASAGDRIVAENYLQHAEHYQRIINSFESDVRERATTFQQGSDAAPEEISGNSRTNDDLSLPASILGGNMNVKSQEQSSERTGELTGA